MALTTVPRWPAVEILEAPLDALPYAVVDLETTGFDPAVDRVLEVAVVRLTARGRVLDQYCTRVHPLRPVGDSFAVHGLGEADLGQAPTFDEVAGEVAERLDGAVVVAHNAAFDLAFLAAEYQAAGIPFVPLGLCTRSLCERLGRTPPRRTLAACCADVGVVPEAAHTARGDARATARLLVVYLGLARRQGLATLGALGCGFYGLGEPAE